MRTIGLAGAGGKQLDCDGILSRRLTITSLLKIDGICHYYTIYSECTRLIFSPMPCISVAF